MRTCLHLGGLCLSAIVALASSSCAIGIKENGQGALHTTFHVPVTYQDAYRRAEAYARHCRTSSNLWRGSFTVTGDLYTDTRTGVVRINDPGAGNDLERIEIAASEGGSDVTATVWGAGVWDNLELAAAQRSIETGTPTCR